MLPRRLAQSALARYGLPLLVALALATLPTLLSGAPAPTAHDEHSYLLGAETFAEGRLTNPTHPHWRHFETIHQLQRPSYQGKYPPAQSVFLAAGVKLGHPIVGVWIGVALMVLALVWMLEAYVPRRWALIGGLVAATQLVILGRAYTGAPIGYWTQSYWGGAVAALGGALVYGALPRLVRGGGSRSAARDVTCSLAMGAGLVLMASSRPKEGLLCALPAAGVMLVWLARRRGVELRRALVTVVVPVTLLLALGGAGMLAYNAAVTGDALRMPWLEHYEQYCAFPLAVWSPPREGMTWSSPELAGWYGDLELRFATRHHSLAGLVQASVNKLGRFWIFFVGPVLTPTLFLLGRTLRRPWMQLAALVCALMLVNNLLTVAAFPHYSAPLTALVLLLIVQGMRHLRHARLAGRAVGAPLCAALLLLLMASTTHGLATAIHENPVPKRGRPRLARELTERGGQHLVFVQYGPGHDAANEWVFNRADLDGAAVVWARTRTPVENRALMEHLPAHRVWTVQVGPGQAEQLLSVPRAAPGLGVRRPGAVATALGRGSPTPFAR